MIRGNLFDVHYLEIELFLSEEYCEPREAFSGLTIFEKVS